MIRRASASRRRNRLWLLEAECLRDPLGGVLSVHEGQITARRGQIGVAHPLHHLARVRVADHGAAEGVTQIVEAEILPHARRPQSGAVALLQGLVADVLAAWRTEDEIFVRREVFALTEAGEPLRYLLGHRHCALRPALRRRRLALGPVFTDVDRATSEVDVPPAQREQLPHPQSGERGRVEDRRVLLGLRRPDQGQHLLRAQHVDLRGAAHPRALDHVGGVAGQAVNLHRSLEDRAKADEILLAGPVRAAIAADPELDLFRRDRLDLPIPELAVENADHVAVVAQGRRLAVAHLLAVVQPLLSGIAEGPPRPHHAGQRSLPRLRQQLVQMRLRRRFREVALGRRGLLRPGPSDPFLHLPPVWQAVFRVPDTAALSLAQRDVPGDRLWPWLAHRPTILARFRDKFRDKVSISSQAPIGNMAI